LKIKTLDSNSTVYHALVLLQKAVAFHLQAGNSEALASIDLDKLKFNHDSVLG